MSRIRSFLLLALLALAFGLAAAPGHASGVPGIGRCNITGAGAGETEAEALANALARLRADYFIFSYTVTDSRCIEIDLTPWNPYDGTETLCSALVTACGFPRPHLFP